MGQLQAIVALCINSILFATNYQAACSKVLNQEPRDETGLLTGTELMAIGKEWCASVTNILDIVDNPVFELFGITESAQMTLLMSLPVSRRILNPFGIVAFIDSVKRFLLKLINDANILHLNLGKRSLNAKPVNVFPRQNDADNDALTLQELIELYRIPCEIMEFIQSVFLNSPLAMIRLGDWPLPLRDIKHDLNVPRIPIQYLKSILTPKFRLLCKLLGIKCYH